MEPSRSGSLLNKRPREEGEIDEREETQCARHEAPPPPPLPPQTMNLSELNMADLENVQSKKELPPFKFPEHREPGRAGRPCRVKCNAVALKPRRALIFYQYDVAFWFNQGGGRDEVPEGLAKMLLRALTELFGQNQAHHSSGERW